tara:strand:- start:449 stop:1666 length:1218 start_codon:yes stop_codon:yes gene_type:complete
MPTLTDVFKVDISNSKGTREKRKDIESRLKTKQLRPRHFCVTSDEEEARLLQEQKGKDGIEPSSGQPSKLDEVKTETLKDFNLDNNSTINSTNDSTINSTVNSTIEKNNTGITESNLDNNSTINSTNDSVDNSIDSDEFVYKFLNANAKSVLAAIVRETDENTLITKRIRLSLLAKDLEIKEPTVRNIIKRFRKRGYIRIAKSQTGPGGYNLYKLNEGFYRIIYIAINSINNSINNSTNEGLSSNTSSETPKVETTENKAAAKQKQQELLSQYLDLNLCPYGQGVLKKPKGEFGQQKGKSIEWFGFSVAQLKQLALLEIEPTLLEKSVAHFLFDCLYNNKKVTEPMSLLFSILRQDGLYYSTKRAFIEETQVQEENGVSGFSSEAFTQDFFNNEKQQNKLDDLEF